MSEQRPARRVDESPARNWYGDVLGGVALVAGVGGFLLGASAGPLDTAQESLGYAFMGAGLFAFVLWLGVWAVIQEIRGRRG